MDKATRIARPICRPPGEAAERILLLALVRQSRCVEAFDATGRPEGWRHYLPRALGRASQVLPSRSGLSQGNVLSHSIRYSPSPSTQRRGILRDCLAEPTTFVRDSQCRAIKKHVRRFFSTLVQLFDHTGSADGCMWNALLAADRANRLSCLAAFRNESYQRCQEDDGCRGLSATARTACSRIRLAREKKSGIE
jgi:hypothetical protein